MKTTIMFVLLSFFISIAPLQATPVPIMPASNIVETKQQINLNKADVKTLSKSMKGIGVKRAEAIVKYREQHGNYKAIEDLTVVPGLGKKFVTAHLNDLRQVFSVQ